MIRRGWLLVMLLLAADGFTAEVEVKGLFSGRALLQIDGNAVLLRAGETRHGVRLIEADSRRAVIDVDGVVHQLLMSKRISSSFSAASVAEVRLQPGLGGHYLTPARINNRPVDVMVDTGATMVAMSLPQAKSLGIDYRNGQLVRVSTANGLVNSYKVMLNTVLVGGVEVENVEALVNMSNFPDTILLGNSYLGRVNLFRENGVLVLQSRF